MIVCAEIDISAWQQYLAAFDQFLAARKRRDPLAMFFARAAMLHELHRDREVHARSQQTRKPLSCKRRRAS